MPLPSYARAAALILPVLAACGDDDDSPATPVADAGTEAAPPAACAPAAPQKQTGACEVTVTSSTIGSVDHVPVGTPIAYCTNPPSGGDHYPVWADFQEYDAPVDWPYLVHSMEHGAVVLLYKCDAAGCPDVVDALRKVRDGVAPDPLCAAGVKRVIIAPSPTIPKKVAAAAWGKTYEADCVDVPTLEAFARDNYGKGTEALCVPGQRF